MRAVVLTANQKFEIQKKTLGPVPPGEVLLKIKACGVCSSDIYRAFENGSYFYPLTMGHEFSGVIEKLGPGLKRNLKVGDHVSVFPLIPCNQCSSCQQKEFARCNKYSYYGSRTDGGYSEYLHVKEWNLLVLPKTISFENGAALEPLSVVYHALDGLKLSPDEKGPLLILGAGFLGLIMVKMIKVKLPDLQIHIMDRNQFKLELALQNGAHKTHLIKSSEDLNRFLLHSFPYVVEGTGHPKIFKTSLKLAAPGGTVIWMGNITGDLGLDQSEVSQILRKELTLKGTWNSRYDGISKSDWMQVLNLLSEGFSIEDLLSNKIQLEEVPLYLRKLHAKKMGKEENELLKIMLLNI